MKEHKLYLGKCDYNNSGRKNCKAYITLELVDGKFSMSAEIWNPRETDCYCGGQCVDTVAEYFKGNAKLARMVKIWRRWHLNYMTAGSPAQEAYLREHPIPKEAYAYPKNHYDVASEVLKQAGLNPDPNYPVEQVNANGVPVKGGYLYGHAWLTEPLPAEVITEIESWSTFNEAEAV